MGLRRIGATLLVLTLVASPAFAAHYRTVNFAVNAPDAQIAKQIGDLAEHYRKEKALLWLGQEMPNWPAPCPLQVSVTMDGPSGATSFQFGQGRVLSIKMEIQGPLDRLLASVLPHEVTHTVFAHHFRQPVPRWADEGGSVLSEDDLERERHDRLTRQILNRGQQIPLRRLFALKEYPREVMCLYAQGYSMCDFLVRCSDPRTFLHFVGHGMQHGWDSAVQSFYGHRTVEELEEAWLKHLRDTRKTQPGGVQLASGGGARPQAQPTNRPLVRLTAPPVQPLDPLPIVRGAAPTPEQVGQRFGRPSPPQQPSPSEPAWRSVYPQAPTSPARTWPGRAAAPPSPAPNYSPPVPAPGPPPLVTLGPIQPDPNYPPPPIPGPYANPVGYPR